MIYFGFNGWGPWHSWAGLVWFLSGVLYAFLLSWLHSLWDDRKIWKRGLSTAVFFFTLITSSAGIAGYYAWFGGGRAQIGQCNADLNSWYSQDEARRAEDRAYYKKYCGRDDEIRAACAVWKDGK